MKNMELRLKNLCQQSSSSYSKWLCGQFTNHYLAETLGLSLTTIRALKRGHASLRRGERQLLQLMIDKKIMPDNWPGNITFETDGKLHLSRYTLNWGQLEHYSWVCERWGETMHNVRTLSDYLDDIFDMMTETQRATALPLRKAMIESITAGKPYEVDKQA